MSKIETPTSATESQEAIVAEFPCTQTQLRCWVLDQLKPGNPALNVAVRWEIKGTFKASTIEAAFRKIIQRHEILRTRIIEIDGQPYQQVVENIEFKMPVIDLRNVPPAQREERVMSIGEETAREPFDLGKAGLLRVTLLMVSNDDAFLLITAHQSCFDGFSIRVLGRELGEIASAMEAGRQPALPELQLQYGDFALWQDEYLSSYGFEQEKEFWRKKLVGVPYFEVPTDKPRGAVKTSRGNILSINKAGDFGERIENAARQNKVSLYSYGAAVISAMLYKLTENTPVMFGTQVAGRESVDLESMIGVFINNVVMRFDIDGKTTMSDHIQAAGRIVNEALNYQNMPFNKLVEIVNPVRDPSRNPLISVNFNQQKAFLEDHRYGGFDLISAPSQSPGVIYDLSFIMIGRPSGWRMSIEYNADLFDEETIRQFIKLWEQTYELALAHAETSLASMPGLERKASVAARPAQTGQAGPARANIAGKIEEIDISALSSADRTRMMGALWGEILNASSVNPGDDFFQLGGHSLLALRMLSAVRSRFGTKPDLELLFKNPTLKAFTDAVFKDNVPAASQEPLPAAEVKGWELTLCKKGTGGGSIYTLNHPFLYYRLANELSDDISVYNVHLLGTDKIETMDQPSLESFARSAADAMQIDPANGPVAILGLCVNGVLAMEVTRQLRERGVEVEFTAVIDAWAPGYYRSLSRFTQIRWQAERRIKRIAYFVGKLLTGKIGLVGFLKEFSLTLKLMKFFGVKKALPSDVETSNAIVTDLLVQAARGYKVHRESDDASVLMFRSQANHKRANRLLFGWNGAVAATTKVIDLEGWHEDSLTMDGIRKLATIMKSKFKSNRN